MFSLFLCVCALDALLLSLRFFFSVLIYFFISRFLRLLFKLSSTRHYFEKRSDRGAISWGHTENIRALWNSIFSLWWVNLVSLMGEARGILCVMFLSWKPCTPKTTEKCTLVYTGLHIYSRLSRLKLLFQSWVFMSFFYENYVCVFEWLLFKQNSRAFWRGQKLRSWTYCVHWWSPCPAWCSWLARMWLYCQHNPPIYRKPSSAEESRKLDIHHMDCHSRWPHLTNMCCS